ncbi:DUF6279 family lipoprotein [Marinobacter bohaiensis]|uniref:DUF6279 family lipoprotein n=1 Tax=Marinobacter bohaiensis TaxID=2201898 RepID=UPI000DAEACBE|nr:DUF6279 family lipoprotein [Marinobacter bohaiensis]
MLLALALLLGGCSTTRFAYQQMDWFAAWWVDDYIPLDNRQDARLQADVRAFRQWHCRHELPRYDAWLADLESLALQPPIRETEVAHLQNRFFNALDRLLARIEPGATRLLSSLSDEQVIALGQAMARNQADKREELLGDDPAGRRLARMNERAERWLGPLTGEQRATLVNWNQGRGPITEIWLEGRGRWQAALMESLEQRHEPHFPSQVRQLLSRDGAARGEAYQAMRADSRQALAGLVTDLVNQSTPAQRTHLTREIRQLRTDFTALSCPARGIAGDSAAAG